MGLMNETSIGRVVSILRSTGQIGNIGNHLLPMKQCFLERNLYEYRFIGTLGFGGKLYYTHSKGFYVSCYREDETPEILETINKINNLLNQLVNHNA
jgi:hypothetical protein